MSTSPRAGFTLPVFACAAAIAALRWLQESPSSLATVSVNLLEPPETVDIEIEQVARLSTTSALAVTRSDPGDNLDLTRHTPIWVMVQQKPAGQGDAITILGGEGIGYRLSDRQPAIYTYARRLLLENLQSWLQDGQQIDVTIVLPEGRSLAERTSNEAFGVVEGLSLLGTSGIAQPLSAPGQLAAFQTELQQKATMDCLVFCIGENGLHLAKTLGVPSNRLIKTANWLGSMLVEAGLQQVPSILLFGYHGKLLKLAGGIFHTHHHVADGRQEILAAHCANAGLPHADVQRILAAPTAEAALSYLRDVDAAKGTQWVERVYSAIAQQIDQRSHTYIYTHSQQRVSVGSVLFGRDRRVIIQSKIGSTLLPQVCYSDQNTQQLL